MTPFYLFHITAYMKKNLKKPLRVGINLLNAKAGAGLSVAETLIKNLPQKMSIERYLVFVRDDFRIPFEFDCSRVLFVKVRGSPRNPFLRVIWEQILMPIILAYHRVNLLYSTGNMSIILAPCKILLFIENTNPFSNIKLNWGLGQGLRMKLLYWLSAISALRASRIRFCSHQSRELILRRFKFVPKSKTFVLYHGLDFSLMQTQGSFSKFVGPYILCVAVIAPHKNIAVLLKAYRRLRARSEFSGKLVIVGNTKCYPEYYKQLLALADQLGIREWVSFEDGVPYNQIFHYYAHASCFVLPSLEETFGIPLIESLYFNVPTVVSDGNMYPDHFIPFRELAKEYAVYFDPYSEEDLSKKINEAISRRRASSRQFVEQNYDIKKIVSELAQEFENA